jgi:hypothetical protein
VPPVDLRRPALEDRSGDLGAPIDGFAQRDVRAPHIRARHERVASPPPDEHVASAASDQAIIASATEQPVCAAAPQMTSSPPPRTVAPRRARTTTTSACGVARARRPRTTSVAGRPAQRFVAAASTSRAACRTGSRATAVGAAVDRPTPSAAATAVAAEKALEPTATS